MNAPQQFHDADTFPVSAMKQGEKPKTDLIFSQDAEASQGDAAKKAPRTDGIRISPMRVRSIGAQMQRQVEVSRRKLSPTEMVMTAMHQLYMVTVEFFNAHRQAMMPDELRNTLTWMQCACHDITSSHQWILRIAIDKISASAAGLDPQVADALNGAEAALKAVQAR